MLETQCFTQEFVCRFCVLKLNIDTINIGSKKLFYISILLIYRSQIMCN